MTAARDFHVVTVGWGQPQIDQFWRRIESASDCRFSHIAHPRHARPDWSASPPTGVHFLDLHAQQRMPDPDVALLESLETNGVPTIRNMIAGDRVVRRLPERDALGYATFLARRLSALYGELGPSAIVGGFDAVHNGIALAVARRAGIPWFALHFSVIPPGLAGFCDALLPTARVALPEPLDAAQLRALADSALSDFESRRLKVPAYLAPAPATLLQNIRQLPQHFASLARIFGRARQPHLRYTDEPGRRDPRQALRVLGRARQSRRALREIDMLRAPPAAPYSLFGLHTQPESSIDVWAPFFSDQRWVIETISRALPPGMPLLVKIHKSDAARYSRTQLDGLRALKGVQLVEPFADSRAFVDGARLVFAIQGTMGLEAAVLGKPVIHFGDSPVSVFPNAERIGRIPELPDLVRRMLAQQPPSREQVLDAYARYLAHFRPAAHNDWRMRKSDEEIAGFANLFRLLRSHLEAQANVPRGQGATA